MSCVQLSEGGFQEVYPLGRSCQRPTWIRLVNRLHLHLHLHPYSNVPSKAVLTNINHCQSCVILSFSDLFVEVHRCIHPQLGSRDGAH